MINYLIKELIQGVNMPVFCARDDHIEEVRGALNSLAIKANCDSLIKVTYASRLLFDLKNATVNENDSSKMFPLVDAAKEILIRDSFYYVIPIACKFHQSTDERIEKITNCTKSIIQRIVYYICDACCEDLGIDMIPGVHCPSDCGYPLRNQTEVRHLLFFLINAILFIFRRKNLGPKFKIGVKHLQAKLQVI